MRDLVKLYEESFKLIIDNPNLTTDKIPKSPFGSLALR